LTRATTKKGVRVKTISRPDTADGRGRGSGGLFVPRGIWNGGKKPPSSKRERHTRPAHTANFSACVCTHKIYIAYIVCALRRGTTPWWVLYSILLLIFFSHHPFRFRDTSWKTNVLARVPPTFLSCTRDKWLGRRATVTIIYTYFT